VVKAVYYSPLAIRYSLPFYQSLIASRRSLFAIRHSLLAIRRHFGSAEASPSHFVPSPVPRPTPPSVSVPCSIFNPNAQL